MNVDNFFVNTTSPSETPKPKKPRERQPSVPLGTIFVTERFLRNWISSTKKGERLKYYEGLSIGHDASRDNGKHYEITRIRDLMSRYQAEGYIHIVQRRIGPFLFSYEAVKRVDA
jgi:hypothetical protein